MHLSWINTAFKKFHFNRAGMLILFYVGLIVFFIALLDTKLLVQNTVSMSQTISANQTVTDSELYQMMSWPLFGQSVSSLHSIQDSNLELVGIIFEGDESVAIIRVDGVEHVLKNKGKINENYTIAKIEPRRIIVSTDEGLKQLQLFEKTHSDQNVYGKDD